MTDEKRPGPTGLSSTEMTRSGSENTVMEKLPEGDVTTHKMSRSNSSASAATAVGEADLEAQRASSSSSSTEDEKIPLPVKVPRSERRGLLCRLCLVAEVENPRRYSHKMKWALTLVVAAAGIAGPFGSAIILPSLPNISRSLHAPPVIANLSLAFYMLALGIFPLWWSFFSERYGRRSIYIVSFAIFAIGNILTAVSVDIGMLIVMRIVAGGASGSVQAVGAGTVADIWDPKERGAAMGVFFIGPLMGPLLAPIIGGALEIAWGWRATTWLLAIYGGVTLLLLIFLLPETLHRSNNLPPATKVADGPDGGALDSNTRRWARGLKTALVDPLLCVKYLRFPAVAVCIYYTSITFACTYVLQVSIETALSVAPYDFTAIEVGLAYLFNGAGCVVSSYLGGRWNDHIMAREARRAGRVDPDTGALVLRPEDRMRENVYLAAAIYPLALLWYGWAARFHLPWPAVLVANFFFGAGSMVIFCLVSTMLTEFMPRRASAGIALNNLGRDIFAFVGIFVAAPLLDSIGSGALFSGLCVITLLSGTAVIVLMKKNSSRWMVKMDDALRNE